MKAQDFNTDLNVDGFAEVDINPESLDPNKHYRIISDRPTRRARASSQKYTPVTEEDGVESLSGSSLISADGLIRVGDGILMCCDKDVKKERDERRDKLTRARLRAPEGQFRKRARESSAGLEKQIRIDDTK